MPIINTGMKREAFLRNISSHLCGDHRFGETSDKEIYFGGGYWRGAWMADEAGVILYNPSVSRSDALVVEHALCILLCGRFQC